MPAVQGVSHLDLSGIEDFTERWDWDLWRFLSRRTLELTWLDLGSERPHPSDDATTRQQLGLLSALPSSLFHVGLRNALSPNLLAQWLATRPSQLSLRSIDVSENTQLGDRDAISMLRMFPGLTCLNLSGTAMGDAALECFALTGRLTSLRCDRCAGITDMGLSRALQRLPCLKHLSVAETKAGDLCLIAAGLSCRDLASLGAAKCEWVTDAGTKAVLEGCRKLRELNLAGNPGIRFQGSAVLAAVLQSAVSSLSLQGCPRVPDDALRVLGKAKPEFRSAVSGYKGSVVRLVCGLALGRRWGTGQPNGAVSQRAVAECATMLDGHALAVGAARPGADQPLDEMVFLSRAARRLAVVAATRSKKQEGEAWEVWSSSQSRHEPKKEEKETSTEQSRPSSQQTYSAQRMPPRGEVTEKVDAIIKRQRGSKMNRRAVTPTAMPNQPPHFSCSREGTVPGNSSSVHRRRAPATPHVGEEATDPTELVSGSDSDWSDWSLDIDEDHSSFSPNKQGQQGPIPPPEGRGKLGFGTQARRFA